eukprot:360880-Chlamydomonas_euryale.AAC.2
MAPDYAGWLQDIHRIADHLFIAGSQESNHQSAQLHAAIEATRYTHSSQRSVLALDAKPQTKGRGPKIRSAQHPIPCSIHFFSNQRTMTDSQKLGHHDVLFLTTYVFFPDPIRLKQ